MPYSPAAVARRRCTARRQDGQPCRCWAVWDDPRQLCVNHAGRHHRGPMPVGFTMPPPRTNRPACRCPAYAWPHRPGAGLCRWPDLPRHQSTTPAGTHRARRVRPPAALRRLGITSLGRFTDLGGFALPL